MYNDNLSVTNKIITFDDLFEIFTAMNEKLEYYRKLYQAEELKNRMLEYKYQTWTFKDNGSHLKFSVRFYDNSSIDFDNYNNFIGIFNTRLDEIKSIYVNFLLSYNTQHEGMSMEWYSQHINLDIYETKMNIEVKLSSEDKKIEDVYQIIKNKILNAPPKYDDVIQKKSKITLWTSFVIGFIPSIIICILLLLNSSLRGIFSSTYILFPIFCVLLSLVIGGTVSSFTFDKLYKNIVPEKKYAGYDYNKGKSIYKDDIEKFVETSEILIGKNINNMKCRIEILNYYNKYKDFLLYEVVVMIFISVIVLFLG